MEGKEVIEGAKIISSFISDGTTPYSEYGDFIDSKYCGCNAEQAYHTWESMKFHTSWDWLMPAVEKIEAMPFEILKDIGIWIFQIQGDTCFLQMQGVLNNGQDISFCELIEAKSKIGSVWQAVIQFILWYNSTVSPKIKSNS